ncbi:hypothetical protein DSO57_1017562 [Entomophthora muscae]|uniref:Uncharacterized protein n=1 Tax=Entomophthora muscae TaxID=34485 RepID=A0ACC2STY3_9FUNG|nr:hypothetical protein DSO57_1017562 [Entomophthora muscae]
MPFKSFLKSIPKASKGKTKPSKTKKTKNTPKKPYKSKALVKTPTSSPEPEETSPISTHSLFLYSLSDSQKKISYFNCHSDLISKPEEEHDVRNPFPDYILNLTEGSLFINQNAQNNNMFNTFEPFSPSQTKN